MPTCSREIEKESLQIWVSAFSRKTGDGQYFLTFLFGFCRRFFPGACLVGIYLYFSSLLPLSFFFASLYTRSMLELSNGWIALSFCEVPVFHVVLLKISSYLYQKKTCSVPSTFQSGAGFHSLLLCWPEWNGPSICVCPISWRLS